MSTYSANHKPLPERDIDPAHIPAIVAAARQLPDVSDTLARNLGGWLVSVHAGMADRAGNSTKSRFRAILLELADRGAMPPDGSQPPRMYDRVKLAPMSLPMAA